MKTIARFSAVTDPLPLWAVGLLASAMGGGLLVASSFGGKWFLMVFLSYIAAAVALLFRDIRNFSMLLLFTCVPIGIQYQLWTHDKANVIIEHFGGNPPEPVINLVDFPIYALILIWIADLAFLERRMPAWLPFDTCVLVFLLVSMLSIFNLSSDGPTEFYLWLFEVLRYAKYYLLYWVLRTYVASPTAIHGFFGVSLAVLVLQGLIACLQYFLYFQLPIAVGGVASTQILDMSGEVIQRVTGLLGHANTFAAYLIIPLSCAMIIFISRVSSWIKAAVVPVFLFGCLTMSLTFSRNGWLTLTICAGMITVIAMKKAIIPVNLAVFVTSSVLYGAGMIYGFGVRTPFPRDFAAGSSGAGSADIGTAISVRLFEDTGQSFDTRWDLLGIAGRMIADHPFIGIGLNTYEERMVHYDINGTTNVIQQPVHNVYALVAAESGVPAGLLFILMGCILILKSYELAKSGNSHLWAIGALGLCTFVGLGFANNFDVSFRKEPVLGLVVIISALVMSCSCGGLASQETPCSHR